jgi:hypothetical protein
MTCQRPSHEANLTDEAGNRIQYPPPPNVRTYEGEPDRVIEKYAKGPPRGTFRVYWINTNNKKAYHLDIEARDYADAAWKVARQTFDTIHPSGRELLDIERLS